MPRSRTRTSIIQTPPRSKAGCWTCRIRRKRCDEQQDDSGACQACVRLDIDCLGWGTRRPDWCRDKDKLAEYKLKLKKKLCTRAGTRPSARHAQPAVSTETATATTTTTTATAAAATATAEESEDEEDTGFFDDASPHLFSPQFTPQFTTVAKSTLTTLDPHLYSLSHSVPAPYRAILHQILDLYAFKSSTPDIITRAREIDESLERLARRAQFDSTFSSLTGFDFNPAAFMFNSNSSPTVGVFSPSTTYSPLSDTPYGLVSPATSMWSPELVPDTLDWFAGYDLQHMAAAPSTPAQQQHQSLDMLGLGLGLDGLGLGVERGGEEYLLFHNEHQTHPQISLLPPSPSHMAKSVPSPPLPQPQIQLQQQPSFESENADPFGIHHASCLLLLHAYILCSPPHETEILLHDLTGKLSSISPTHGGQYAFAALLTGQSV